MSVSICNWLQHWNPHTHTHTHWHATTNPFVRHLGPPRITQLGSKAVHRPAGYCFNYHSQSVGFTAETARTSTFAPVANAIIRCTDNAFPRNNKQRLRMTFVGIELSHIIVILRHGPECEELRNQGTECDELRNHNLGPEYGDELAQIVTLSFIYSAFGTTFRIYNDSFTKTTKENQARWQTERCSQLNIETNYQHR